VVDHGWRRQLLRYALVGMASNSVAYLCYLALTQLGLWPTVAMTIVYVSCAFLSFLANRRLTFSHQGDVASSGARYIVAHVAGYTVNALLLFVFVDRLGYPHAWVQAAAIVVVAVVLFLAMKYFVFPQAKPGHVHE
jgi:putative flippase GtrA